MVRTILRRHGAFRRGSGHIRPKTRMTTPNERKQIETNEGVFPPYALKRAQEHRRLAHEFYKAAQTPGFAALPRVTLTVESVYLCALAALGAADRCLI
jgi:hypothetical protein